MHFLSSWVASKERRSILECPVAVQQGQVLASRSAWVEPLEAVQQDQLALVVVVHRIGHNCWSQGYTWMDRDRKESWMRRKGSTGHKGSSRMRDRSEPAD